MAPSCVNYLYPSAEESWEEMTKIEPRNMSHQIPAESEMSRQNRATPPPPESRCRTFLGTPLSHFLSFAAGRGCGGLEEGIAVPKTDRATGRYRSYSHTSRATLSLSVQLSSKKQLIQKV